MGWLSPLLGWHPEKDTASGGITSCGSKSGSFESVCGSIFLVDGPMNLKASGFSQCSVGWGTANREDKISALISSGVSNTGQGGEIRSNLKEGTFS